MENYTKEDLKSLGLSDEQIRAILNQTDNNVLNSEKEHYEAKVDYAKPYTDSDITTMSQLSAYSRGNIVSLPEFSDGQPFIVRLRRPSLLVLMKSGKIPNALLSTASELFEGNSANAKTTPEGISKMYDVMNIIAEASLVEPTMEDIRNANVQLTDEQLIAIFNYSQSGIKGLQSFREE